MCGSIANRQPKKATRERERGVRTRTTMFDKARVAAKITLCNKKEHAATAVGAADSFSFPLREVATARSALFIFSL